MRPVEGTGPIVTLTTDFGYADHFAGVMKGVILTICPQARIVDITHEVPAYSITVGAFVVGETYRHFPSSTVHLAVVDPGVGSSRRPILIEAAGQFFVGPDNGIFGVVLQRERSTVRELTVRSYWAEAPSHTFHGRDIFAPVAAHLAAGTSAAQFGPIIEDALRSAAVIPVQTSRRGWTGEVVQVDRFGNLISNFHIDAFPHLWDKRFTFVIGMAQLEGLAEHYASRETGELMLIVGSSGYLEVAANQSSAAKQLGCGVGSPIEITFWKD